MNRIHKVLIVVLAVVLFVWGDQEYKQYKIKKKYHEMTYGSAPN